MTLPNENSARQKHDKHNPNDGNTGSKRGEGLTVIAGEMGLLAMKARAIGFFLLRPLAGPRLGRAGVVAVAGGVGGAFALWGLSLLARIRSGCG